MSLTTTGTFEIDASSTASDSAFRDERALGTHRLVRFALRLSRLHLACGMRMNDDEFAEALQNFIVARAIAEHRSSHVPLPTRTLVIAIYAGVMRAAERDRKRLAERNAPALRLIA